MRDRIYEREDSIFGWDEILNNTEHQTKSHEEILEDIPLETIEKFLRKKKLQKIQKNEI